MIGTTPALAQYPEGCGSVEDGPTSLYAKGANSNPKQLFGTFCTVFVCDIVADLFNNSRFAGNSVYWCE
jgi:hypothetical protein